MDYLTYAKNLKIIPVWDTDQTKNKSGFHTPPELYTPYQPFGAKGVLIHATVGADTLPYFADSVDAQGNVIQQAGSVRDGRQVLAHQLIPKDNLTIYDLVPEGYGCGHARPVNYMGWNDGLNFDFYGIELENLQNGADPFTEGQYVKLALTVAYKTARHKIPDWFVTSHHIVAPGSRSDPDGSNFQWGRFWTHLWGVRQDNRVFSLWQLPVWLGR